MAHHGEKAAAVLRSGAAAAVSKRAGMKLLERFPSKGVLIKCESSRLTRLGLCRVNSAFWGVISEYRDRMLPKE